MLDMREYDVPYIQRVCTDRGIRVGLWYTVTPLSDNRWVPAHVCSSLPVSMRHAKPTNPPNAEVT